MIDRFNFDDEITLGKKVCGIYGIECRGVVIYVGQSKNIRDRWMGWKTIIRNKNKKTNRILTTLFKINPPNDFSLVILELLTEDDYMFKYENKWYDYYQPIGNMVRPTPERNDYYKLINKEGKITLVKSLREFITEYNLKNNIKYSVRYNGSEHIKNGQEYRGMIGIPCTPLEQVLVDTYGCIEVD